MEDHDYDGINLTEYLSDNVEAEISSENVLNFFQMINQRHPVEEPTEQKVEKVSQEEPESAESEGKEDPCNRILNRHHCQPAGTPRADKNKRNCIVCYQNFIVIKSKIEYCSRLNKEKVGLLITYSTQLKDKYIKNRIHKNKIIWCHNHCFIWYIEKFKDSQSFKEKKVDKVANIVNGLRKIAYAVICNFVNEEIIIKEGCTTLQELYLQYKTVLYTLNEYNPVSVDNYITFNLYERLVNDFSDWIVIKRFKKHKHLVYKKGLLRPAQKMVATNISWTYKQIKRTLDNND